MDLLINALDKDKKESLAVNKLIELSKVKNLSDKIYEYYFSPDYEVRFKPYDDLDKCNEGFIRKKTPPIVAARKKKINIEADIQSLDDIIKLVYDYPLNEDFKYDINIEGLHKIKPYLEELNAFVGLEELKENLLDQLIYFIHEKDDDYLHTVLYGPPGTGKTEIAKILGKIYTNLGILKKGTFVKVTRSDFVAGYLGQTAIKTRKLIEQNLGGVIFIDEAYALGNEEKKDSFSKEALDTLCELLSDHKKELMVIIAGYKEELKKCFFSYNPGLKSRFAWQFEIKEYSSSQLSKIFEKKVKDARWILEENIDTEKWFEKKMDFFKNYGRDVENFFSKCKICHFRRIFGKRENKHILSRKDLESGFNKFSKHNNSNSANDSEKQPNFMYT